MSMSSTGLYDQPLNEGANEAWAVGRRDALVLERYLSRSLQTLMGKGDGEPTGVLRDIQTLLAFCMNEYALQTAARCTTRGRLLRKLGDGYERLFVHLIDLLTQEREAAEDAQKSFQDDYDQEMEMVKAKVLEERSFANDESSRLKSQIVELQASLDRARADLESSNAKNGSLQMECDLYRQECDKAWAAKAQLEQRCSTAEARARDAETTAQDPDAAAAGSNDTVSNAEDWFNQTDADTELNRVREEKRLLESKLDAVTTAVLAGGGVEALQSALARVASGSRPSDMVSQSSSHWDESRTDGFRNNATSVVSGRRSRGASRGTSRPSSEETAGVWRPARSASPDTPNRLVAPGRPDSRGADGPRAMGFSPGAGTLEDTYYQQLRQQGSSGSGVGSRGLSSSENRRPRSQK
eukprot:COSAG02_NODE_5166_length_4576_cov_87.257754_3_plen_411_part_00